MKYPCGDPGHPTILGIKYDAMTADNGFGRSVVAEYRSCGCITWRYA